MQYVNSYCAYHICSYNCDGKGKRSMASGLMGLY